MHEVSSIAAHIKTEISKIQKCSCGLGSDSFTWILSEDCNDAERSIHFGNGSAWCVVYCACGRWIKYVSKPENLKKRRSARGFAYYYAWWREKHGGVMKCWLCGQTESDSNESWQHHHIDWVYEDGKDYPPEEIRIIHSSCHAILTAIHKLFESKVKHGIKVNTDHCGADDVPCSINPFCKHFDCKNCESRIEVA
ncbi:MAG: hypothetical protein AB2L14_25450 [Candidatus Xenobiia bacterium LiM19]